ncbi:alpha/beta fold hydrolase [Pararhizobium qamdonense]|uniref:alpha/beta fold hydrolase n=1 Tax=Pararhizobium qamdonense TaxID=3031126 RepID=UPI0023E30391|nr:alpha/beta hydrolase [Pararhizobium qamdonense]
MYAEVNGTRIFFDTDGSSLRNVEGSLRELPTVVALHGGLGFDHGYLREGLGQLASTAQVVYVDLRGQGRSDRTSLETATLEQMADDIADLIKTLGISKPHVFGHSAGGFVAMHLALQNPGLLGSLILCGSSPTVAPIQAQLDERSPSLSDRASPQALAAAGKVFSGDITLESVATFFEEVGPFYAGPANADLTSRLMRATIPNIEMMRHFMTNLAPGFDLQSELHHIAVPVLVLVGAFDWVCPPHASRTIAKAVPRSTLVEFENSGHFPFSEEPEKFRAVVEDFFASNAAPGWY